MDFIINPQAKPKDEPLCEELPCQEEGEEPCPEDCIFFCHYPWYCEAFHCKPTHT